MRAGQVVAPYYSYAAKLPKNETLAIDDIKHVLFARWKFQLGKASRGGADRGFTCRSGSVKLELIGVPGISCSNSPTHRLCKFDAVTHDACIFHSDQENVKLVILDILSIHYDDGNRAIEPRRHTFCLPTIKSRYLR